MYLGDNFIVGGIESHVAEFSVVRPDAQIMLTQVADPWAFGVAELDPAGRVVRLEEKPQMPRSDLALVEPGAQVSGSRIVGPVVIGAGSKVTGSYVGRTTSGPCGTRATANGGRR
jgi:hypothetical protein